MLITIGALRVKGGLISSHHTGISPKHFEGKESARGSVLLGGGVPFIQQNLNKNNLEQWNSKDL